MPNSLPTEIKSLYLQPVSFTHHAERSFDHEVALKIWIRKGQRSRLHGVVVGFREKQDGRRSYLGDEEGYIWQEVSRQWVALVSISPFKNPIPVFLEDLRYEGSA